MAHKPPSDGTVEQDLPELGRKMLWADNPHQVSVLIKGLMVLCLLLFVLDFIIHRHAYFSYERWYGFYAFAGFVSFSLIVLAAKQLRRLIIRPEDYYAQHAVDAESYPETGLEQLQHGTAHSVKSTETSTGADGDGPN